MGGVVVIVCRRAEDAQRAVPFELVDPAAVAAGDGDDRLEEGVEGGDDLLRRQPLGEGGRSDHVDVEHRGVS